MIFKRYEWRLVLRVLILFVSLLATVIIIEKQLYYFLILTIPLIIFEVVDMVLFQKKAQDEVGQFVESIHYRDFSRHFDERKAPNELKPLRKGFNEINSTFKLIIPLTHSSTQYTFALNISEIR